MLWNDLGESLAGLQSLHRRALNQNAFSSQRDWSPVCLLDCMSMDDSAPGSKRKRGPASSLQAIKLASEERSRQADRRETGRGDSSLSLPFTTNTLNYPSTPHALYRRRHVLPFLHHRCPRRLALPRTMYAQRKLQNPFGSLIFGVYSRCCWSLCPQVHRPGRRLLRQDLHFAESVDVRLFQSSQKHETLLIRILPQLPARRYQPRHHRRGVQELDRSCSLLTTSASF